MRAAVDQSTIGGLLAARMGDTNQGLRFEDDVWTWDGVIRESAVRASVLQELRRPGPFHVGVLLDNVPDFVFFYGAAGLAGAVIVPINPTRRGAELARDIADTDIQLVITDSSYLADVQELGLPLAAGARA